MRLSLNYLWDNFSRSELDPLVSELHTSSSSKQTKRSLETDEKTFWIRGKGDADFPFNYFHIARPANPQVVSDFDYEVTKHTSNVEGSIRQRLPQQAPDSFQFPIHY